MKHFKLTIIVFGLLLFGWSQAKSNTLNSNRKLDEAINIQPLRQGNFNKAEFEDYELEGINETIAAFKTKNIDKISNRVRLPLYREYPIPPIKNKEEFKKRFNEVFDKILVDEIAHSRIEQWSKMGWRGIMLDNGVVWMQNYDGIITVVNYQSNLEKKIRKDLIAKEKESLHISLKNFEIPIYKIKTKNYLIRIDQLSDYSYRYASWKKNKKESSKPDIIINNGEIEFSGTAKSHVITFVNGNYAYKIYRNMIMTDDMSEIELVVEKNGKSILTEDGELIIE